MRIEILGTRGEIPDRLPYHSKHSGILVDDELMIDLGEKGFLKREPSAIIITHLHPDHAYFVRYGKEEVPLTRSKIYAPENKLPFIELIEKESKIGKFKVQPIPTHHSKNVKSQAYVIHKGSHSFLYTGDLVWLDRKYHPLIGKVDLVIMEASFLRKGGLVRKDKKTGLLYGHNGIPNLISLFKAFSSKFLLMHFGSWFYKSTKEARKKIKELSRELDVEILVGYDRMIYEISKTSQK